MSVGCMQHVQFWREVKTKVNIREVSLKSILGENWRFEPDFCYADVFGNAELYENGDRMVLFRKEGSTEVSAIHLRAILNYNKKLFCRANELIAEIGIDIKMGDKLSKIVKKFGTPAFVDYVEEDYYRYYNRYYRGNYYDYNDEFYVVRYHYLLSSDLLVCFGVPKIDNYLTDLEIVNDFEMVSEIMKTRTACKESNVSMYQPKECIHFVNQKIQNRIITELQLKDICFAKVEVENCSINGIRLNNINFRECVFNNVTFNGHFEINDGSIERCKFVNCIVHDINGGAFLELKYCFFQHCLFEKISMHTEKNGLYFADDEFLNCIYKEIKLKGEVSFTKMEGGKMEKIFYKGNEISCNKFSNVQIKDVELELNDSFSDNELKFVSLSDVKLKGNMEENNVFLKCNINNCILS